MVAIQTLIDGGKRSPQHCLIQMANQRPQDKPVQVYIMLGQSNMLGFGRMGPKEVKGSLEFLVHEKKMYPHLVNDAGKWTVRNDVRYVHVMHNRNQMQEKRKEWLMPNGSFRPGTRVRPYRWNLST
jgi:hypothetical protein